MRRALLALDERVELRLGIDVEVDLEAAVVGHFLDLEVERL